MKHYKHLTSEQRYQISALLKTGISQSQIARTLGIDKSTIRKISADIVLNKLKISSSKGEAQGLTKVFDQDGNKLRYN